VGLCGCSLWATAQQLSISGKVIDADSLQPVPSVHIYIKGQEQGTISNVNGFFNIALELGDTLIFSSVNYESKSLVPSDSMGLGRLFLEVLLRPRTVKLKEVVVYGQLNPAAVRRYLQNVKDKKRADNPPDMERNVPKSEPLTRPKERKTTVGLGTSLQGGAALEGALTGLANLFNKRAQQQKRIAKLLEARKQQEAQAAYKQFIAEKFNQRIVAEATGLSGYKLQRFVTYCNFSDEFIYSASEYEMLAAIFAKLRRFDQSSKQ